MKSALLNNSWLLVIFCLLFTQCKKTPDAPLVTPKSSAKSLTSPTIDGVTSASAVYDAATSTYTITVPFGTDITALKLAFTLSTAAIAKPASGSVQNFTNPVIYTVTAEDGSTQNYTVKVNFLKNSAKDISNPAVSNVASTTITYDTNTKSYTVTVPGGTDVKTLKFTFTLPTGATANPTPGSVQDFTNPVKYTVTAEDGSTQVFTVTVLSGDIGQVSFQYLGKQVTYKTVRAKDGNIWLQQNVGSSRVAIAIDDTASYGDFFQWGRWDDGHQVRKPTPKMGTTLPVNNPSGIKVTNNPLYFSDWWNNGKASDQWTAKTPAEATATNGCDPCQAIGAGWRLPTDAEWTALATNEGIINSATAFASTLKIPTGGWRSFVSAADLRNVGVDSWFWSSNASEKTPTYGLGIWIRSSSILTSYPDVRAYGTSMRCIKK